MSNKIIQVENVSRVFKDSHRKVIALKEISFEVFKNQLILITGESGSGKTTLLKLIGLLDRPTRGNIQINGINISSIGERERARIRLHNIGFIFQKYHLFPDLTALENVAVPFILAGFSKAKAMSEAVKILNDVGLIEKKDTAISVLSGGEAQRVAIARAISLNPEIILADEPTGNLDKSTEEKILNLLLSFQKEKNKTLLLVTHNLNMVSEADQHIQLTKL